MEMRYYEILTNPGIAPLSEIPVIAYKDFFDQTVTLLKKESCHCVNYFTHRSGEFLKFFIAVANDDSHKILIYAHSQPADIKELKAITSLAHQMHVFEREISENTGIVFKDHPWPKPLRYPFYRSDKRSKISGYPFYNIESEETHEVGVGPVHAGVIEPGHFRFICHGEKVLHLEIQLGYQHRGVEPLLEGGTTILQKALLAENIAGDSAIGHGIAFNQLVEALAGLDVIEKLKIERIIALEMERIAVHIGDMAALCGDVAYQIGQVTCEALRTMVINTTQDWCGNRFGKGLIRPGGSNYPLTSDITGIILENIAMVYRRFMEVTDLIFNDSGILARFEFTGQVSYRQALLAGAVGMAARTTGIRRDIRKSHPFQSYTKLAFSPDILESGDVLARACLRKLEFESSYSVILELISRLDEMFSMDVARPDYSVKLRPGLLGVSLTEGWRGEICHIAITGIDGSLSACKVKDASLHNWHILALAVREQEISDFPVCNKSFNLSYCGNDL